MSSIPEPTQRYSVTDVIVIAKQTATDLVDSRKYGGFVLNLFFC